MFFAETNVILALYRLGEDIHEFGFDKLSRWEATLNVQRYQDATRTAAIKTHLLDWDADECNTSK